MVLFIVFFVHKSTILNFQAQGDSISAIILHNDSAHQNAKRCYFALLSTIRRC